MKLAKHIRIVMKHRKYVRQMCFKMGIRWQGIVHDISKYSLRELSIAKYYVGTRSPHAVARDEIGYSPSWIHHYHRNKHHWQYWLDIEDWPDKVIPVKMPYKYVIEMFCDFVGAGKAYNPGKWDASMPWAYWVDHCAGKRLMHSDSERLLKKLIWNLKKMGMAEFLKWYKASRKDLREAYEKGQIGA